MCGEIHRIVSHGNSTFNFCCNCHAVPSVTAGIRIPTNSPGRFHLLHVITCLLLLVSPSLSCPATALGHQLYLDSASSSISSPSCQCGHREHVLIQCPVLQDP